MLKRTFDFFFAFIGIIVLSPFFLIISCIILLDSKGGILYIQKRVGRGNKDFRLFKFRTMYKDAYKQGLLTIDSRDKRITRFGHFLRKFKLDELPQLFNVLVGNMSFVGPRPEVRKYVDLYDEEQRKVMQVKPGITDIASIEYYNENDLLGKSNNPEQTYINQVMPAKIKLNLQYISNRSFAKDIGIIFKTIVRIFK